MKEKLKGGAFLRRWFDTQSPLVITRPALRQTLVWLLCVLGGFVLSCGRVGAQPAPFALALLATLGGGLRGLGCLAGAAAGYLIMQPFDQGLPLVSAGILVFVCCYIFSAHRVAERAWFRCVTAGGMTALVELIFLLSQRVTLETAAGFAQTVLLAGLSPLSYTPLLAGKKRGAGSLLAVGTVLLGAAAIPLPWGLCLGGICGAALVCAASRQGGLAWAACGAVCAGAALDLALGTGCWTVALGIGGALGAGLPARHTLPRVGAYGAGALLGLLYTGGLSWASGLTVVCGMVLGLLIPAGWLPVREDAAAAELVEERLSAGTAALRRLYAASGVDPEEQEDRARGQMVDRAAGRVCRRCGRYAQCWEREARETYQLLRPAMTEAARRGRALREDFPQAFQDRCAHLEPLMEQINQELDQAALRRRVRNRQEEARVLAGRCLLHMSRLLGANARQLRAGSAAVREKYEPLLGVAARGRGGVRLSGDRGASLRLRDGTLFVILCDGVGTGQPAAEESALAVDTMVSLLQAGMPPDSAMELLNGMYLLRDTGSFSTMDVLELSLLTGQGTIYKWGAAPSYVRSGDRVLQLGTAAPPPGLGAANGPELISLTLWPGDLLVLVSDGAAGPETEALLREFPGDGVKALAAQVVEQAAALGREDDMTAVALRLTERRFS